MHNQRGRQVEAQAVWKPGGRWEKERHTEGQAGGRGPGGQTESRIWQVIQRWDARQVISEPVLVPARFTGAS